MKDGAIPVSAERIQRRIRACLFFPPFKAPFWVSSRRDQWRGRCQIAVTSQTHISHEIGQDCQLTMTRFLVFHGGSGSSKDEIKEAVNDGVVKMNVDTDTQASLAFFWYQAKC
jgi:hypothetical protein